MARHSDRGRKALTMPTVWAIFLLSTGPGNPVVAPTSEDRKPCSGRLRQSYGSVVLATPYAATKPKAS